MHAGNLVEHLATLSAGDALLCQSRIDAALGADFWPDNFGRAGFGLDFGIDAVVDGIGKAVFDSLCCRHERLGIHQLLDVGALHAGAGLINVGERGIELVEQGGSLAHVVAIADDHAPGIVHHHERTEPHADFVTGHGDDGSCRCRPAQNLDRDLGRMAAQQVVNGDALEHVAARRIDPDSDGLIADRTQRRRDAVGGDAAA